MARGESSVLRTDGGTLSCDLLVISHAVFFTFGATNVPVVH